VYQMCQRKRLCVEILDARSRESMAPFKGTSPAMQKPLRFKRIAPVE